MVERNQKPADEVSKIRDLILKKSSELTRQLDEVEKEKKLADMLKKEWEAKMARISQLKAQSADLTI